MDGITYVTDEDPVTLTVTPHGTVIVATSEGGFAFRTTAHFDRAQEDLDRQRAALGFTCPADEPLPGLAAEPGEFVEYAMGTERLMVADLLRPGCRLTTDGTLSQAWMPVEDWDYETDGPLPTVRRRFDDADVAS